MSRKILMKLFTSWNWRISSWPNWKPMTASWIMRWNVLIATWANVASTVSLDFYEGDEPDSEGGPLRSRPQVAVASDGTGTAHVEVPSHAFHLVPVAGPVKDDRDLAFQLVGLAEGQHLEELIEGPEAAREDDQGTRQVREPQLAHEEVVKLERQARRDEGVRALLMREPDVEADGAPARILASRAKRCGSQLAPRGYPAIEELLVDRADALSDGGRRIGAVSRAFE